VALDDDDTEIITEMLRGTRESTRPGRLSLIVMGPTGIAILQLPEQGDVVIGRAEECEVHLADSKLSRRHAIIRIGGKVELTDLASRNGTTVREHRLAPHEPIEIGEGDVINLGTTVLVLQSTPLHGRPRRIWSHGYLEARLEEECARADHGASTFALLRLRFPVATAGKVEELLAARLRPTDILASYAPSDFEILLLQTSAEEATAFAQSLGDLLRKGGVRAETGLAVYPRDGRTPESLVAFASARGKVGDDAAGASSVVSTGAFARMEPVIKRVAMGDINVLVLGETGVGKEILARTIHARSPRARRPMLCINCAALAESLLESELFGHEKGAFTGAVQAKTGLLESAEGGVVFLDEVGEMPLAVQAKLLRVLEQREVLRVGALKPRHIDVRFVSATNRDLDVEVAAGRFRSDLYFRLDGISMAIPPLRERVDEIEPLARAFVAEACHRLHLQSALTIDEEALSLLHSYQWPGNVRELRNIMERAVLLCSGRTIGRAHLPAEKMGPLVLGRPTPPPPLVPPAPTTAPDSSALLQTAQGPAAHDRHTIVQALEKCGGNQSKAAKLLGISRGTLINRIEQFGLPRPRKREEDT
jgi:two-component system, NtrC family, response regulator AtoC